MYIYICIHILFYSLWSRNSVQYTFNMRTHRASVRRLPSHDFNVFRFVAVFLRVLFSSCAVCIHQLYYEYRLRLCIGIVYIAYTANLTSATEAPCIRIHHHHCQNGDIGRRVGSFKKKLVFRYTQIVRFALTHTTHHTTVRLLYTPFCLYFMYTT